MKYLSVPFLLALLLLTASCNKVEEGAKQALNKGGETVGKTATEFVQGVSQGIDKTLQCEVSVSKGLSEKGIKTGKFAISNDSTGGQNNLLSLYLIFEKDCKENIFIKAYDKNGLEFGRVSVRIEAKAGQAGYYDIHFDKRTVIEAKSKIVVE